jgi:hypothetical protein
VLTASNRNLHQPDQFIREPSVPRGSPLPALSCFIEDRLAGTAPLGVVFWRDMLLVGTGLAIASLIMSLVLAAHQAPTYVIMGTYFAALPYTLFIAVAVWRSSRHVVPVQMVTVRTITACWAAVAVLV